MIPSLGGRLTAPPISKPSAVAAAARHTTTVTCSSSSSSSETAIRVCMNRTCNRQGSKQILRFAKDVCAGMPGVDVDSYGCMGECGSGPNIAVFPSDPSAEPILLHHITTPYKMAEALRVLAGIPIDDSLLKATELRLSGNAAAMNGKLEKAIAIYSEALQLNAPCSRHMLLANRSAARLASGDAAAALEDAAAAVECAPAEFTTAAVRQADALFALGRFQEAKEALAAAAERYPQFGKGGEYKQLQTHITKALESDNNELIFL